MKKVLVAMSGGIDSSVAAALLQEQGFDVRGATMELSAAVNPAIKDAKLVADALSIPHYTVDAAEIFENIVIKYFINEYRSGRTPNPCVVCNRRLKFGLLMSKALELGCDHLATGHYAVIDDGELRRGVDVNKDQSYFLYPILQSAPAADKGALIDKIIFPLGRLTKGEVRTYAKKLNLPAAEKSESQDICFIPSGNYQDFLRSRGVGGGDHTAGHIIGTDGKILGRHTGIHNFTIGQRKGLGALGKRMYVKQINAADNTVIAAEEQLLESSDITLRDVICSKRGLNVNDQYQVQIRYRSKPAGAKIVSINDSQSPKTPAPTPTINLRFSSPVKSVTPGQSAVIYDGDTVIAGGVIGFGA
ncbi:MAG: tRNA 2-thiouridine(34) synthase MnmA [Chitinispirillales bacterium]|jgi:tRNA-specific 2-thiouridylase|nr:tRNA 2-thiouridine(34) synthase MnmA [Chitinispirillales bacterium]